MSLEMPLMKGQGRLSRTSPASSLRPPLLTAAADADVPPRMAQRVFHVVQTGQCLR
jgi:hypothetical protein